MHTFNLIFTLSASTMFFDRVFELVYERPYWQNDPVEPIEIVQRWTLTDTTFNMCHIAAPSDRKTYRPR